VTSSKSRAGALLRPRPDAPLAGAPASGYIGTMNNVLVVLLFLFMLATAAVLLVGVTGFALGGRFNDRWGNKLMQARVGLQLVAVVILGLLLAAHG
jgi:hypothetical protein